MTRNQKIPQSFFQSGTAKLLLGDVFEIMGQIPDSSVDMVFADPPYFLSNGGISCQGGKQVSVNKGDWDSGMSTEDKHEDC